MKKLTRLNKGRRLAGVCLGIARYLDVDPTVVRLLWVLVTIFTGIVPGIVAYILAWIIMPKE